MAKLIAAADIHGSISSWKRLKKFLKSGDSLAVAGDLFDTRYGDRSSADFRPDIIKKEFLDLSREQINVHYVYGNCDLEEYMEGFSFQTMFEFDGFSFLLNHGHLPLPDIYDVHVIIEGHSHTPRLDTLFGKIFLNPGSPSLPRNSLPGFAVVENGHIQLRELTKGKVLDEITIIN